jgi:hypothetical protein
VWRFSELAVADLIFQFPENLCSPLLFFLIHNFSSSFNLEHSVLPPMLIVPSASDAEADRISPIVKCFLGE